MAEQLCGGTGSFAGPAIGCLAGCQPSLVCYGSARRALQEKTALNPAGSRVVCGEEAGRDGRTQPTREKCHVPLLEVACRSPAEFGEPFAEVPAVQPLLLWRQASRGPAHSGAWLVVMPTPRFLTARTKRTSRIFRPDRLPLKPIGSFRCAALWGFPRQAAKFRVKPASAARSRW